MSEYTLPDGLREKARRVEKELVEKELQDVLDWLSGLKDHIPNRGTLVGLLRSKAMSIEESID